MTDRNALANALMGRSLIDQPQQNALMPKPGLLDEQPGWRQQIANALMSGADYAGRGLATADLYSGGMLSSLAGLNPFTSYQSVMEARDRALEGVPRELKAMATEPINPLMGIFAGPMARTANKAMLRRAEELAAQNAPREQIWNETGWFKGVDGKWRFEIDDFNANLSKTTKEANERYMPPSLDQFYDHPELYEAYPKIREIRLRPTEDYKPGSGAYGRYIKAADDAPPGIIYTGYDPKKPFQNDLAAIDVIPHEAQHAIQYLEDMAKGGSPRKFTPEEIAAERARLNALNSGANDWTSVGTFSGDTPDDQLAMALYKRLAGEVEARAVQKRLNMLPSERRARAPWLDYDVPEDQQIVRYSP